MKTFCSMFTRQIFYHPGDTVLAESSSDEEDPGIPPKTREENFWALIAGDPNAVDIEPKTKIEYYMKKVAQNIQAGLLPVPTAPVGSASSVDAGKVPTVKDDGTYELAAVSDGK